MRQSCVLPRTVFVVAAALVAVAAGVLMVGAKDATAGPSEAPAFLLPWEDGVTWKTGVAGFHGTNEALDFFPPDSPPAWKLICEGEPGWYKAVSGYHVLSAAAGIVIQAEAPYVTIDHGGGWRSGYLHLTNIGVEAGEAVAAGQALGRPSTYGFCTTGPHVHFWISGPDGATTQDVSLSGLPTTEITLNESITLTGNVPGGSGEPTPTPAPTSAPTPTPEPGFVSGDTDCDGDVDSVDGLFVLLEVGGIQAGACTALTADVNCSGMIDALDALHVMRHVAALPVVLPQDCSAIGA